MNKEETKEAIKVMQAFVDGKEIEFKSKMYQSEWENQLSTGFSRAWDIVWAWDIFEYRIKSKPVFVFKPEVGFTFKTGEGFKGTVISTNIIAAFSDKYSAVVLVNTASGDICYYLTKNGEYSFFNNERNAVDFWTDEDERNLTKPLDA